VLPFPPTRPRRLAPAPPCAATAAGDRRSSQASPRFGAREHRQSRLSPWRASPCRAPSKELSPAVREPLERRCPWDAEPANRDLLPAVGLQAPPITFRAGEHLLVLPMTCSFYSPTWSSSWMADAPAIGATGPAICPLLEVEESPCGFTIRILSFYVILCYLLCLVSFTS
jgi:hypothetical protein